MRTLLRPRWLAAHMLVAAACVTFVQLGEWQLRRLDARRDRNALIASRARRPAAEITPATPDYRRVRVTGTYDTSREVLLRGRERNGSPGFEVLTPLVTAPGSAVIVDRGWVPLALDRPADGRASPPAGPVRVDGIYLAPEYRTRFGPRDPPGRLETIGVVDVPRLARQLPYRIERGFVLLSSQSPPQVSPLPATVRLPEPSDGPHLSYAVQWFAFVPIALIVYCAGIRTRIRRMRRDPNARAHP